MKMPQSWRTFRAVLSLGPKATSASWFDNIIAPSLEPKQLLYFFCVFVRLDDRRTYKTDSITLIADTRGNKFGVSRAVCQS